MYTYVHIPMFMCTILSGLSYSNASYPTQRIAVDIDKITTEILTTKQKSKGFQINGVAARNTYNRQTLFLIYCGPLPVKTKGKG